MRSELMRSSSKFLGGPSLARGWPARSLLIVGLGAATLTVVSLHSAGMLPLKTAIGLLFVPLFLVGAAFRPAWLILLLVAIPPGLLTFIGPGPLVILLGVALLAQTIVRMRLFLDVRSGLYPLIALIVLSLLFQADVGSAASTAGDNFRMLFAYYTLLSAVTYGAVRLGDLSIEHLSNALLIGIFGTAVIKVAQGGLGPATFGSAGGAESLYFGRNFAYLAVIGFGLSFGRWLLGTRRNGGSLWHLLLATFFLVLVATSLVRGPWIAAMLTILITAWFAGRRSYWLLLPLALVIVLMVPVARERVASRGGSSVDITTGRGGLWTRLWEDHVSPAMPWGNGFGYAWSLTPDRVFGFRTFLRAGESSERFIYPHNDFLFWMIEFGLVGLTLFIIFWFQVLRATRFLLTRVDLIYWSSGLLLLGVMVTTLVAHFTANAYAIRPLAERCFVAAAFLFGMRSRAQHEESMRKSQLNLGASGKV
jgi:hypothetical protein